ncbi:MAG: serine protein kinase [Proteobacteria bacterium]|jgi:serine protein kinase|nr:serine protein kinase [Pseudomonadota bacterium]
MDTKLEQLANLFDRKQFKVLHEEISFAEYLERCYKTPRLIRTAYQRLYDMIMSEGTKTFKRYRKTHTHYCFFDNTEIPIFGLDETLESLVKFIRGAAGGYGTEKRVLLLHGPVGSSKSTICRCIKRGMEYYSNTEDGIWYTFKWVNLPTGKDGIYTHPEDDCPMHEEPLKLLPLELRKRVVDDLNEVLKNNTPENERTQLYTLRCDNELDPRCKKFMNELLQKYEGDWGKVIKEHIRVVRKVYSEPDRMGIATFQPKDEKNQDSTELTGDINYAKLPHFGSDSDPRAFNFDGEFCIGNRGVVEFIEVLKLAKEFLYDLLGASQEQQIKPKKFAQISVDTVLIGHTNNPEFEKLRSDNTMEALRDRTVRIDVPYLLRWGEELAILEHYYGTGKVKQHVAPHTLEIAALWTILTRLQDDKEGKLSLVDKAKLLDGRSLPGYTEDTVKELRDKYPTEGMSGVSCRYTQDKISNCLAARHDYINQFMVLNEIKEGLDQSSLITNKEDVAKYIKCVDAVRKELDDILKNEVQKALVGDEDAIIRLCTNYIDNVRAYINKVKVINQITGEDMEPNERLMRSIEEKIDIPEAGVDEFRRGIAAFIGSLSIEGKVFRWDSNAKLKKALEMKLFEDTKDHIKLSALDIRGSSVVDPDIQQKIDAIKQRLIKQYGYNEQSATDVLAHVGSIFSRGDVSDDE